MKKTVLFLFILIFSVSLSFSQAVEVGNKFLNLDIGLKANFGYGLTRVPPITLRFDYMLKQLGPGTLSVGGLFGFAATKDKFIFYSYNYSYVLIAARAAYHWFPVETKKIDTYAGIVMGANIVNAKYVGDYGMPYNPKKSRVLGGGYVGFRYLITDNLGVNAELGYNVAILNIGGSYKF